MNLRDRRETRHGERLDADRTAKPGCRCQGRLNARRRMASQRRPSYRSMYLVFRHAYACPTLHMMHLEVAARLRRKRNPTMTRHGRGVVRCNSPRQYPVGSQAGHRTRARRLGCRRRALRLHHRTASSTGSHGTAFRPRGPSSLITPGDFAEHAASGQATTHARTRSSVFLDFSGTVRTTMLADGMTRCTSPSARWPAGPQPRLISSSNGAQRLPQGDRRRNWRSMATTSSIDRRVRADCATLCPATPSSTMSGRVRCAIAFGST